MDKDLKNFQDAFGGFIRELQAKKQKHNSSLYIYLGDYDKKFLDGLRALIPGNAFLLYIYPPSCSNAPESAASGLTLFSALDKADEIAGKIWFFLTCFKLKSVNLSYQSGFAEKYCGETVRVKEIADEALLSAYHSSSSRLIKLRCSIHNLPLMLRNAEAKISEGTPALICGSGPSLKNQIEIIKRYSPGVLIIAVGRLGSKLINAGIHPDFIVQVDPASDFDEWKGTVDKSILAAVSNVSPAAAMSFDRIIWSSGDSSCFNKFLKEAGIRLPELKISRTSTVTAVDLAVRLGCARIALAGNDLCLSLSGASHMEGYMDENIYRHEVVQIEGNDSEKVFSTLEFNSLRKGLESYLSGIDAKTVSVYNCTEKGARINYTSRMGLEDFLRKFSVPGKKISCGGEGHPMDEALKKIPGGLARYAELLNEGVVCCESMIEELKSASPDGWCLEKYEEMLEMLQNREKYLMEKPVSGNFISAVNEQVEELIFETPYAVAPENDRIALYSRMRERYRMLSELCSDLEKDFEYAMSMDIGKLKKEKAEKGSSALRSPVVFSFFRKRAISVIRKSNPELAEALEKEKIRDRNKKFDLYLHWQELPFVRLRAGDGNLIPLSGNYLSMEKISSAEVDDFIKGSKFGPEKNAVVFAAPGNWLHVMEFARRYPYSDIIVVENWPELLSEMIDYSLFMHLLPEKTVITASHESLKDWKDIYVRAVNRIQSEGKKILLFENPYTWKVPEVREMLQLL